MDFKAQIQTWRDQVHRAFDLWVPLPSARPARLHEAMRYSLDAGGKRLRPLLLLGVSHALRAPHDPLPAAVAVECLHTYSLIHDDLPCLDNSPLRRGLPTCHCRFDEATALLAGDALLTQAFLILPRAYAAHPALATALVDCLAAAASSEQLIGGQMEDLLALRGLGLDEDRLAYIHRNKTAALLAACVVMGALLAEAAPPALAEARHLGLHLGLAFQAIDDLLDATSDPATLGKPAGHDAALDKVTAVSLLGLDGARRLAARHSAEARAACARLAPADPFLPALLDWMEGRSH